MAFFNESFLNDVRTYVMGCIDSVRYKIGPTIYVGTIKSKLINGESVDVVVECSNLPDGEQTVDEVILYDVNEKVIASKIESVTKAADQGILFKFKLPIKEV